MRRLWTRCTMSAPDVTRCVCESESESQVEMSVQRLWIRCIVSVSDRRRCVCVCARENVRNEHEEALDKTVMSSWCVR